MKVARTARTFTIPYIRQSWPSLAMYSRLMTGPCSGAEKHLRTLWTLILSSGASCLLHRTSFPRLAILLLLEVRRRRDTLLHQTFPYPRMLAPHSIPGLLPMELSCPGMRLHTIKKDLSGTQLQEQENAANYGALTTTLETSICRDADIIGQPLHGEGQESARELLETTILSWVATGRLRLMKVQSAENVANVPTNHVTQRYCGETAFCWYGPTTAESLCWSDSGAACHVCPPS